MENKPLAFAVKHKNIEERMESRSGGIFTAVSDIILEQNGVVYGCALDENLQAVHIRAETTEERNRMRGSKYVQSRMGSIFRGVKDDLEQGRKVLFTGTFCQVAGLKSFLMKPYENLYCMDIICHAVPSPLIYRRYLQWQEERYGKIKEIDFRNKKDFGWHSHIETLLCEKKKVDDRVWTSIFYNNLFIRPSCYECPYKTLLHESDITIGDYWGIEKAAPGFDDNNGVSLVLINSDKGLALFEATQKSINFEATKIEDSMQQPLCAPYQRPEKRNEAWTDFSEMSFDEFAKKYGRDGLKQKIKIGISRVKKLAGKY